MSGTIRAFVPADGDSLGQVINAVCGEGQWMSTPCFEPTPAWSHALAMPGCSGHLLLVAEDAGRVLGWCRLFPLDTCNGRSGDVELGIGLSEAYRGRGLGKALLGQALDWAVDRDTQRVALTVRTDNARATGLFRRFGFRSTGREVDGWTDMDCRPRRPGG